MSTPFLSEIKIISWNYAPKGWTFCNGQTLQISQNQALFALLGTTYGGNGQTTFQLPNLQSRLPMHFGVGAGLSSYNLGQVGGEVNHTLISSEIPQHVHSLGVSTNAAATPKPAGSVLAAADLKMYSPQTNLTALHPSSLGLAGGSQPHSNEQPYLVLNYIIALQGIFPSRN